MPTSSRDPLRILVVRARAIGDTVLIAPALRNLRKAFPNAHIDLLASPHTGEVLRYCPYIDELHFWQRRTGAKPKPGVQTGVFATARWLRSRRYDRAYNLRRAASSALLLALAGIPHRVGFATELGGLFLHRSVRTPADRHEVECALDVLRADGISITDTSNEGWSDPNTDALVASRLPENHRHRIFLCAKSSLPVKDWPLDHFATLVTWLVRERHAEIHLCDSPAYRDYYATLTKQLAPDVLAHCHDWSAELSLAGSLSLIRRMDLAVGVDTGLLHLAAGFHVPVVSLIGPQAAITYYPWDTRYRLIQPPSAERSARVAQIDPTAVRSAIDELYPEARSLARPAALS
jgi:ADP-heptose:LPS heptosyltransferase